MGSVHTGIDGRQVSGDTVKLFHDLVHALGIGRLHVHQSLPDVQLGGGNVIMDSIQIIHQLRNFRIDIGIGICIPLFSGLFQSFQCCLNSIRGFPDQFLQCRILIRIVCLHLLQCTVQALACCLELCGQAVKLAGHCLIPLDFSCFHIGKGRADALISCLKCGKDCLRISIIVRLKLSQLFHKAGICGLQV